MWKYVLPPVAVVMLIWIATSSVSMWYMQWIEQSHQRVLDENVASIQAADDCSRSARRFEESWPAEIAALSTVRPLWKVTLEELNHFGGILAAASHTPAEQSAVGQLHGLIQELHATVNRILSEESREAFTSESLDRIGSTVRSIVQQIGTVTAELRSINQTILEATSARQKSLNRQVFISRLVLMLVGPVVGVGLGLRLSRRLQDSVTQIAVTLGQSGADGTKLGKATSRSDGLLSDGLLDDVQHQAEQMTAKLQNAHDDVENVRSELVRSERLAAVGQLAAGVAHELRNPMTSVKLLLQHAARQPGTGGLNSGKLQLILEEIGRMESTIEGLLDFSRDRPLRRTHHDLAETLRRALNLIEGRARQQRVTLAVRHAAKPLMLDGDAERLHQVLVNLLINAIEAMPAGGGLSVGVTTRVNTLTGRQTVAIEVRDTGTGIPEQVMPRLFEPFATTKARGTGLGLAVSRRIVDQHEGRLVAANHVEGGAVFTVTLPLSAVDNTEHAADT